MVLLAAVCSSLPDEAWNRIRVYLHSSHFENKRCRERVRLVINGQATFAVAEPSLEVDQSSVELNRTLMNLLCRSTENNIIDVSFDFSVMPLDSTAHLELRLKSNTALGVSQVHDLLTTSIDTPTGKIALESMRRGLCGLAFCDGSVVVSTSLRHCVVMTVHFVKSVSENHPISDNCFFFTPNSVSSGMPLLLTADGVRETRGSLLQIVHMKEQSNQTERDAEFGTYHDRLHMYLVSLATKRTTCSPVSSTPKSSSCTFIELRSPPGDVGFRCLSTFASSYRLPYSRASMDDIRINMNGKINHHLDLVIAEYSCAGAPLLVLALDCIAYVPPEDSKLGTHPSVKAVRSYLESLILNMQLLVVFVTGLGNSISHSNSISTVCDGCIEIDPPKSAEGRAALFKYILGDESTRAELPEDFDHVLNSTAGCNSHELVRLARSVWCESILSRVKFRGCHTHDYRQMFNKRNIDIRRRTGMGAIAFGSARRHDETKLSWDRIGGYAMIKLRIQQILYHVSRAQADAEIFTAASGMLLHGPTGCGKTLLVNTALANCSLNVLSVDSSDLMSKYVGETEALIKSLFRSARKSRPSIIFIDEIDSLAHKRGKSSPGTGVEARALSQLLNEMDGIQNTAGVFVIGCTNRPLDSLDSAILRPGRLEIHLFVDVTNNEDCLELCKMMCSELQVEDEDNVIKRAVELGTGKSPAFVTGLFKSASTRAILRSIGDEKASSRILAQDLRI